MQEGSSARRVLITLVPHSAPWPDAVPWADRYIPEKESVVALGVNRCQQVTNDFAKTPHLFIVGRTGSGKSIMLLSVIYQLLKKSAMVYIADFKGGIDYNGAFRRKCTVVTDYDELLNLLTHIMKVMRERVSLLYESGCHNIDEYNNSHPDNKQQRIVLVVDEAAEALSAPSTEYKKTVAAISESLISISRLARAANINIIMAAQRGGSEIISPSLRVNLAPIIGSCDAALSIMVTGSADASKLIPPNTPGRFIYNEEMLQGYFANFENLLLKEENKYENE